MRPVSRRHSRRCKHLRISVSYFYQRYTVTETEEGRIVAKKTYKDLKGREFDTWRDLCNANGYSYSFCRNYKVKSSDFDSENFNFEKVKALDENSRKPSPACRDYAAQVAIVKEMTGRNGAAQLAIVKQMSRQ